MFSHHVKVLENTLIQFTQFNSIQLYNLFVY